MIYERLGEYTIAIELYEKILIINPKNKQALSGLNRLK